MEQKVITITTGGRGTARYSAPSSLDKLVHSFLRKAASGFRLTELREVIREWLGKNRTGVPRGADLNVMASALAGAYKRQYMAAGSISCSGRTWSWIG